MKSLMTLVLAMGLTSGTAMAKSSIPNKSKPSPSKKIELAVNGIEALAESGVRVYAIEPQKTVKDTLLALAISEAMAENEDEFNWVGKSDEAWGADSSAFGETDMRDAYHYIFSTDNEFDNDPKGKKKWQENVRKGKEAFKLFLKTGVQFGLAPMGAVQCGVTFAALAIIDPHSGKIYIFAREGSGC